MSEFADIINSKIIDAEWDALWQDTTPLPQAIMLVITTPYSHNSPEELQLHKMMQACKLEHGQYQVLQLQSWQKAAWHKLRDMVKPEVVLLLGVHPKQLGISVLFHLFAPNRFNEKLFLAAPTLDEMEQQPDAKKQLWGLGLKPLFVDKTTA